MSEPPATTRRTITPTVVGPSTLPAKVSVGLSTVAGLGTAAGAFILALVAFINGHHDDETIGALATGAAILYAVVRGRAEQAAAITQARARVEAAAIVDPPSPPAAPATPQRLR